MFRFVEYESHCQDSNLNSNLFAPEKYHKRASPLEPIAKETLGVQIYVYIRFFQS